MWPHLASLLQTFWGNGRRDTTNKNSKKVGGKEVVHMKVICHDSGQGKYRFGVGPHISGSSLICWKAPINTNSQRFFHEALSGAFRTVSNLCRHHFKTGSAPYLGLFLTEFCTDLCEVAHNVFSRRTSTASSLNCGRQYATYIIVTGSRASRANDPLREFSTELFKFTHS